MYHLQRAYDFDAESGKHAVLLDRLWPRGLRKQRLEGVIWEKDATPSNELRGWFHEDPQERFDSFGTRFTQELADSDAAQEALKRIRALHRKFGSLTLLTAARDPDHSHLSVLAKVLKQRGKAAS
ncbi:DUF488 domain-containing protein [Brachymonas denitrificans]|jgi:uncharacterized protein YeaO (DUF488 family)|uniref:DUF488 domain-containing protein n=1 Tax=Brachymonas denitrificans TaxID=28220 RepID=UPI001BCBDAA0|nr:DUF488 family protein [Brachymonas denitrificans]